MAIPKANPSSTGQVAPAEPPVSRTTDFCDRLAEKNEFVPYNMNDSIDAAACDARFKGRYQLDCRNLIPGPLSGRCYIQKK
jgi:hypothetical protein